MKKMTTNLRLRSALAIALSLTILAAPVFAQGGNPKVKTNTKILYHNGPVMTNTVNLYLIYYGNWTIPSQTWELLFQFLISLGNSPYFYINSDYPNASGGRPNAEIIYVGDALDAHSQGPELDHAKIQQIIIDRIVAGNFPLDTTGIYLVLGSPDVSANYTGFCTPNAPPYHGLVTFSGVRVPYSFIGNPMRCPTSAAPQFTLPDGTRLPTPNNDFAADGMANTIAAVLSATVTNPWGDAWFDRYGLENSTKCQGFFGTTYTTANGARANMWVGGRDWLIHGNWVNNTRKGFCALARPDP